MERFAISRAWAAKYSSQASLFSVISFLLVIYNHGDISIPSFIRYHLTIARFSRTIESWNGL
ncbi:hypothetical protein AZK37_09965, partial [Streptococcus pneumoniae]